MEWKIGNIKLKNQVVLAPMAGVSNPAYMLICQKMGVSYVVSELISAEAIVRNNKKTFDMLRGIEKLNVPVAIQLFGSSPETMAFAAKKLLSLFKIEFIDINFGCPVPKVAIKSHAGSALLKDPDRIKEIVSAVVNSVSVPVTVKIRSGWDGNSINAVLVAKVCEEAGASAIAIHARTRSQGYGGSADWNIIKEVKKNVSIPVIGNGDIRTIYDAKNVIDKTKCDAIMIGRAALGNPWFIRECVAYLEDSKIIDRPNNIERIDMIKYHYQLLKENSNEKVSLLEIRSHALWYLKGIPDVKEFKNKISSCKTEKELFDILECIKYKIFEKEVL